MASSSLPPAALSERFSIASFGDEGILFDLATGWFGRLNARATRAWERLLAAHGSGATTAASDLANLAKMADIPEDDVRAMLGAIRNDTVEGQPDGLFHYVQGDEGFVLRAAGAPTVRIDARAHTLQLCDGADPSEDFIARWLDAVAPKLLSLQGLHPLHASAARVGHRVLAFSGASGAGKTTTARTFARAPRDLLSIDVLVVCPKCDRPPSEANDAAPHTSDTRTMACLGAERAKDAWIREATRQMVRDPRALVSLEPLRAVASGERVPLDELWFIDAAQRVGNDFALRPMRPVEAFLALLTNSFLGTGAPSAWRTFIDSTRQLALEVRCCSATMPQGLEALAAAVQAL